MVTADRLRITLDLFFFCRSLITGSQSSKLQEKVQRQVQAIQKGAPTDCKLCRCFVAVEAGEDRGAKRRHGNRARVHVRRDGVGDQGHHDEAEQVGANRQEKR